MRRQEETFAICQALGSRLHEIFKKVSLCFLLVPDPQKNTAFGTESGLGNVSTGGRS